jgi:O-antigen/teichoic acid export membrane protein
MMLSIQAVQWVLVLMLDETATGLFVAPLTMVMIINPFLMGVTNVFLPASASALASGKSKEVRSGVHMLALFFVPLMAGFLGAVILFGPDLMPIIYGAEYAGHDLTLILLAVTVVLRTFGIPANIGLWVFERTRENFFCGAMGFLVTMAVTLAAVPSAGVAGAAFGLVAGDAVTSVLRWWRWRQSRGDAGPRDATRLSTGGG